MYTSCFPKRLYDVETPGTNPIIKNVMVPVYKGYHLMPQSPSRLRHIVMMLCLASVAAEFLVSPAVPDPVSALKTYGHMPLVFLIISHRPPFF